METNSWKRLKRVTPKLMIQRLPVVVAQVKAGKVIQIIYSLYREKEVTKNVYNSLMNSI